MNCHLIICKSAYYIRQNRTSVGVLYDIPVDKPAKRIEKGVLSILEALLISWQKVYNK
jgi:hypothetical protein